VKDQYVGDINDFAKYQLLRICSSVFGSIVVGWMLTSKDDRSDGAKIAYLKDPSRGIADIELFEALGALVDSGDRTVAGVESTGVLGGLIFHAEPMPSDAARRAAYFTALAAHAGEDSLVFLDPDNGFEVASVTKSGRGSERYLYWDELAVLRETGTSILVYQHFPRVPRQPYLEVLLGKLAEQMGGDYGGFAAFTSQVGFLFAVRERRAAALREAVSGRCEGSPLLSFMR